MARPERPANFGLEPEADRRLTEWMRERLELAVWVKPSTTVPLTEIETGVIRHWQPPLNIDKVDRPLPALRRARQAMADDARAWARARGFAL